MLKICLAFWKSEPQYAYKRYAYKETCTNMPYILVDISIFALRALLKMYGTSQLFIIYYIYCKLSNISPAPVKLPKPLFIYV